MLRYLICFALCALLFLGADFCWLNLARDRLYQPNIGSILADRPNLAAAAAFYFIYISGIIYFAITPTSKTGGVRAAFWRGLALGLFAYGAFDLTSQAIMKVWSTTLTVADMTWGGLLTAVTAAFGYQVLNWSRERTTSAKPL